MNEQPKSFCNRYLEGFNYNPKGDGHLVKSMVNLANNKDWKTVCEEFLFPIVKQLDSLYNASDILEDAEIDPKEALIEVKSNIKAYGILDSCLNIINKRATKKLHDIEDYNIDDYR